MYCYRRLNEYIEDDSWILRARNTTILSTCSFCPLYPLYPPYYYYFANLLTFAHHLSTQESKRTLCPAIPVFIKYNKNPGRESVDGHDLIPRTDIGGDTCSNQACTDHDIALGLRPRLAVVRHVRLCKKCDKARAKSVPWKPLSRDTHESWAYENDRDELYQDPVCRGWHIVSGFEIPERRSDSNVDAAASGNKCYRAARKHPD